MERHLLHGKVTLCKSGHIQLGIPIGEGRPNLASNLDKAPGFMIINSLSTL